MAAAREMLDELRPKLHVCGHMHRPYRAVVEHTASGFHTSVCCCSKVGMPHSIALFRYDPGTGEIVELGAPTEEDIARNLSPASVDDGASSDEDGD